MKLPFLRKRWNYQSKRKAQTYPFLIGDGYYRDRLLQKEPPEAFYKKDVLQNFEKFREKLQCQSLFFNKMQAYACNFIKKWILPQVFSCEFGKIFENAFLLFLQNTSWRLFLLLTQVVYVLRQTLGREKISINSKCESFVCCKSF